MSFGQVQFGILAWTSCDPEDKLPLRSAQRPPRNFMRSTGTSLNAHWRERESVNCGFLCCLGHCTLLPINMLCENTCENNNNLEQKKGYKKREVVVGEMAKKNKKPKVFFFLHDFFFFQVDEWLPCIWASRYLCLKERALCGDNRDHNHK